MKTRPNAGMKFAKERPAIGADGHGLSMASAEYLRTAQSERDLGRIQGLKTFVKGLRLVRFGIADESERQVKILGRRQPSGGQAGLQVFKCKLRLLRKHQGYKQSHPDSLARCGTRLQIS